MIVTNLLNDSVEKQYDLQHYFAAIIKSQYLEITQGK